MNTRIIQITFEGVKFNPNHLLLWKNSNLTTDAFSIRKNKEILWEVSITQIDAQTINFSVLDFNSSEKNRFENQVIKRSVNSISFDPLDWVEFQKILSSYQFSLLEKHIILEESANEDIYPLGKTNPLSKEIQQLLSDEIFIDERVEHIRIEDLDFHNGYVMFQFDYYLEQISVKINNPYVYRSLDLVKSFFSKVLKTNFIIAKMKISVQKMNIISVSAQCDAIDKINKESIAIMKNITIENLDKLGKDNPSCIFSLEDLISFSTPGQSEIQEPDRIQITQILDFWINKKPVRNRAQLKYLSGHFQSPSQKIRLTITPKFGFLFCRVSEKMQHFCWELLDSNASYLWSFNLEDYSISKCVSELEGILSIIKTYGRNFYRMSYKTEPSNHLFHPIHHESKDLFREDGFNLWKDRLESKLI